MSLSHSGRLRYLLATYFDEVGHDHEAERHPENKEPPPGAFTEYGIGSERNSCRNRRSAEVNTLVGKKNTAANK
jgi:hypothetical protein